MHGADDRFGATTLDGGRVTLDAPLGEGGMGTVFRGRLRDHDGPVAVKLLRVSGVDPADRPTLASRLRDEASAAARVVHPNLVRILASGDCPQGGPYIVYELVEGGSLEERLEAGPLPWEEVEERLAPQLLGALGALHAAGVVHRDVKPDNIFVTPDGRYLLGDLGLAVFEGRSAATATGVVVGTPGYLAPERVTRPDIPPSSATDVYAAAMVLVRAAAGRLPFAAPASAPAALVREQLTRVVTPAALSTLGLPSGPARALAAALAPQPSARPAAVGDLLASLRQASATRVPPEAAVTLARVATPAGSRRRPVTTDDAPLGSHRPRVASLVALTLGLVVLALLAVRGPSTPGSALPSSAGGDADAASLQARVAAARPLLPDEIVDRLLQAAAEPSGAEFQSLLRSVSLAAGTTSPAGQGARLLAGEPDRPATLGAARAYAELLAEAEPGPSAQASALLAALVGRAACVVEGRGVESEDLETEGLATAVFLALAHLPSSTRHGPRGRSLALALEVFLARSTPGGIPACASGSLAAALGEPSLGPLGAILASALAVPLPRPMDPVAYASALEGLAGPALALSRERGLAIKLLATDNLRAVLAVRDGATGTLDAALDEAVTLIVGDWYRMVPAAITLPLPSPPAALPQTIDEVWSLAVILLRRGRTSNLRPAHAGFTTGPLRPAVLVARLAASAVTLAERASAGDGTARTLLIRDCQDLVRAFGVHLPARADPLLDGMEALLATAPDCRVATLALRGNRLFEARRYAEARALFGDAAEEALRVAEGAGPALVPRDLSCLRHCLYRLRAVALEGEGARRCEELRRRARDLGMRLSVGALEGQPMTAAASLLVSETKEPLTREFGVE